MESLSREIATIQTWSCQTRVCRHLRTTCSFSNVNQRIPSFWPSQKNELQFRLHVILGLLKSCQIIPGLGTVNLHPGQDLYQASWSGWRMASLWATTENQWTLFSSKFAFFYHFLLNPTCLYASTELYFCVLFRGVVLGYTQYAKPYVIIYIYTTHIYMLMYIYMYIQKLYIYIFIQKVTYIHIIL